MLGTYENFPKNVHKILFFNVSITNRRLQQAIIQTFYDLNNRETNLEEICTPTIPHCTVLWEWGIAETNGFNYLDNEETKKTLDYLQKKTFQTTDFFCSLRYYKKQDGEKKPLRFDYYMIRFVFGKAALRMDIFHERGPRYVSPEEIANFAMDEINRNFSRNVLKTSEP